MQTEIEDFLKRHCDTALQQDVGPAFGFLANMARELEHADAPSALSRGPACGVEPAIDEK